MTTAAYRDRITGAYPISLDTIRANAGALFGEQAEPWVLEAAGVDPVEAQSPPSYNPTTHMLREGEPRAVGQAWQQTWQIVPVPAPPVPHSVSNAQAKIALVDAGLYTSVLGAVAGTDDVRVSIWFNNAQTWERDNLYVAQLAAALGLDSAAVDALFIAASHIT